MVENDSQKDLRAHTNWDYFLNFKNKKSDVNDDDENTENVKRTAKAKKWSQRVFSHTHKFYRFSYEIYISLFASKKENGKFKCINIIDACIGCDSDVFSVIFFFCFLFLSSFHSSFY